MLGTGLSVLVDQRARPARTVLYTSRRPYPRSLVSSFACETADEAWLLLTLLFMPASKAAAPETKGALNDVPQAPAKPPPG